ncbi:hypothetical protein [Flavobacterium sp. H122]|uniref:hypothetical protein n=1 Tax=Flavobacterium sp. H122 TaxID=2529860 RepID=UPI0010AAD259|nr:hypothetical protein [Flavobacterium sp. H122]
MKQIFILAFFTLLFWSTSGQTIIKLNYDEKIRYKEFSFVNPKDSIFLEFKHREDMGHRYGFYYVIKKNIPDNEYKIVVNETLKEHFVIKNAKLNGIKKVYYETGELYSLKSFEEGIESGSYEVFYKNGNLKEFANYIKGDPYIITELDEKGKIIYRRYFLPKKPYHCVRSEMYDNDGRIARIQNINEPNSLLWSQEAFKNGKLNFTTILHIPKEHLLLNSKKIFL